jgi:threonyl-tRNA synthetase
VVIPVSDKVAGYAAGVAKALKDEGIRVALDSRNERLQKKIRDAETEKIPYMAVVGEKESQAGAVSVRSKAKGDMGAVKLDRFIEEMKKEIEEKAR